MKVQFELTIGENKFTLIEDVESHADFFKKLDFYSGLPKTGPNGETDLVLRHRMAKTKDGKPCAYFSIVSQKAGKEFKFGQSQHVQGALFPKGWEPLYNANGANAEGGDEEGQPIVAGQSVGLGAPAPTPAPAQQAAAAPARPASVGLGAAQSAPRPAPAPAQTQAAPAGAPPAQVQNQAKSVLSKFGI